MAIGLLFVGCSKKEDLINPESVASTTFTSKSQSYPVINCWNGMLHFASMEDVKTTLTQLENAEAANLGTFVTQYGQLNEDQFNDKVKTEGFIEEQPLIDFENRFPCFNSLRKKIAAEELVWLANDELNEATDPDNHFIDDEHVRIILNDKAQIRIGDNVYVHYEKCYGTYPYLSFTGNETADCMEERAGVLCKSNRRVQSYEPNPSNSKERTKMVVSHMTYPWGRYATARLKNYKKIACCWHLRYYNGWNIAKVYGFISGSSGDCGSQVNFNPSNASASSQYAKKIKHKIHVETLTSTGWVKGDMRGLNGSSKTKILTFSN